jgi:hypothetical protein
MESIFFHLNQSGLDSNTADAIINAGVLSILAEAYKLEKNGNTGTYIPR